MRSWETDVEITSQHGAAVIRMMHPGGGSAYALSYPSQKMVESFQGGEKPQALFAGHYHKYDVCYPREVFTLQAGCLEDQTPFMRKKKLCAHVGFIIVTMGVRLDGTLGFVGHEWHPFYDAKYHRKLQASQ